MPDEVARVLELVLDARLEPEEWSDVRSVLGDMERALDAGAWSEFQAGAEDLNVLIDPTRLAQPANPEMDRRGADPDIREIANHLRTRIGERPADPRDR